MEIIDILKYTIKVNASDLHLSSGLSPIVRVDGDLSTIPNTQPLEEKTILEMLKKILPASIFVNISKSLDLDLAINVASLPRFRVNIFHQYRGLSAAFRAFPQNIPTIKELKLSDIFYDLCELPNGLILITGPAGSGKTTTLAAMIDHINTNKKSHILTIEDPIEYVHFSKKSLVEQREVKSHTESFETALRAALREDPNFILVGEMRDLETIRLALTAAETGRLVLATLHTNSAAETINRIVDAFPSFEKAMIRWILSSSLKAVISQILVKKIEGGRTVAQEIMVCNTAIRNLIRQDKTEQIYSAIQTGQTFGMRTLDQHLQVLVDKKIIDGNLLARYEKR